MTPKGLKPSMANARCTFRGSDANQVCIKNLSQKIKGEFIHTQIHKIEALHERKA